MADQGRRLEMLVRQGLMPAQNLPILKRAIARVQMGSQLLPNEREIIKKFMDELMFIVFGDDTVFNRAKQNTQKNRYQTEEHIVSQLDEKMVDGVEVVDGDEERMKDEKKAKKLGKVAKSEKMKMFAKSLRKEKEKEEQRESLDITDLNKVYQSKFDEALEEYGVSTIRDLPEDKKKEFFALIDEKMAKKDHDGDGKIETKKQEYFGSRDKAIKKAMAQRNEETELDVEYDFNEEELLEYITAKQIKMARGIANDPRHKGGDYTGAAKKMEKIKKGLSNHPAAQKALRQANESLEDIDASDLIENPLVAAAARTLGAKGAAKFGANKFTQKAAGQAASSVAKKAMSSSDQQNEEMTPEQKAERLALIKKIAIKVRKRKEAESERAAEMAAKRDMRKPGAQKGMAPLKKEEVEMLKDIIRGELSETAIGVNRYEAFSILNQILQQNR